MDAHRGPLLRTLLIVGALLWVAPARADEPIRLGDNLQLVPLGASVFVVDQIADPYQANALLVKTAGDAVILVDTPNRESDAALLYEWIRSSLGEGPLTVINSHFHPDSTGSNGFFREKGAEILGSAKSAALLRRDGNERLLPTKEFELSAPPSLDLGGETVRIVFPGPAHSPEGVVVYFPKRGLLFGSCLSKTGDSLGYLADADIESWPSAMREIRRLGATRLVPGHGRDYSPGSTRAIENTLRLLAAQDQ